ncbi:uncharacterized protein LOC120335935 [Styela clava]|uniref:uncharacterized protein LOC120335935 n=1 Tax=Styela clava TaxID=7725 RepID=UPI00193991F2|nr:uncharacterized protein LOC120335935 [Styela clava]
MSGKRFLYSDRPKEIGDLYIGCENIVINNRGTKSNFQAKREGTDCAKNVFIGCHNVKKDDRESTCKVQGSFSGSASMDVFEACSDVTIKQQNSVKEVAGGGVAGTETSIVTARNTDNLDLLASGSDMTIKSAALEGSSASMVVLEGVKGGTLDFTSESAEDTGTG